MRRGLVVPLLAGVLLTVSSCSGPAIDLTKAVQVTDLTTGWYDAGVENGLNKLIPTVGLRLKNDIALPIRNIELNAVFRRVGETEEWGTSYTRVFGNGLPPGVTSEQIVLRSNLGYTSTDPRSQMLRNSEFKDVHVRVFAKQGAAQWAPIGEWDIQRALILPSYKPQPVSPKS